MAAKEFASIDILSLVDLEIAIIERYNDTMNGSNQLSIIYFCIPNGYEYGEIFEKILRRTDVVIKEGDHYIAVLYHTDKNGAAVVLSGIQEFLNSEPIDVIITYPKDGKTGKELIAKLQDEIKDNYGVILKYLNTEEAFDIFEERL
ncbi:nucleotidyl cyclase domain-containing protein [Campylobacter californiensis]|uniref:pyridoxal-5'-phosphate-dependent protein n=1 Tax=Campylobacter californiensis TaxID=1032243 RepID=UPI001472C7F9|nr:pyridoxal-5'-phosphate-dependent protein [Campylobacter sp. RM12916]MBE3609138.1 pyridoxal-5'-phosphate-dependent protein [Campylobacter sp. RM12916]